MIFYSYIKVMILSIDVGIRTLAMCIIDTASPKNISSYEIKLWKTVDTLEQTEFRCKSIQKNGKICDKKCSYVCENNYSCKTHFPKEVTIKKCNKYAQKKIKDYLLQDLSLAIIKKMNEIHQENEEIFSKVKHVLIELQPHFAVKMKFISHILYGKLAEIFINSNTVIRFVRATEKLKVYNGPKLICSLKGAYCKRKWLSKQHTKYYLETKFSEIEKDKWMHVLSGKHDDACDAFLYCMYHYLLRRIKDK